MPIEFEDVLWSAAVTEARLFGGPAIISVARADNCQMCLLYAVDPLSVHLTLRIAALQLVRHSWTL